MIVIAYVASFMAIWIGARLRHQSDLGILTTMGLVGCFPAFPYAIADLTAINFCVGILWALGAFDALINRLKGGDHSTR